MLFKEYLSIDVLQLLVKYEIALGVFDKTEILRASKIDENGTINHFTFCFRDLHNKLWIADISLGEMLLNFQINICPFFHGMAMH